MAEAAQPVAEVDVKRIFHGDDLVPVVDMLARRYENDPLALWMLKSKGANRGTYRRCKVFFNAMLRIYLARSDGHVIVHTDSDNRSVMVWHEVGEVKPGIKETLRLLPAMLRAFGVNRNAVRVSRMFETQHPRDKVYAYLQFRGWELTQEGEAAASAVLTRMLDRLDLQKNSVYTEAAEDEIDFLQTHGFVRTGELKMPEGAPPCFSMWREYKQ